jgi:hypothetical protein
VSLRTCPECSDEIERLKAQEDDDITNQLAQAGDIEALKRQLAAANAEIERLQRQVALERTTVEQVMLTQRSERDFDRLQLAAMTAARDEIYNIAKRTFDRLLMTPEEATRLDALRLVSGGEVRWSRHALSGRELSAVHRAIDIARDADLLEWDTHDQRVLAIAALDRLFADGSVG